MSNLYAQNASLCVGFSLFVLSIIIIILISLIPLCPSLKKRAYNCSAAIFYPLAHTFLPHFYDYNHLQATV